MNYAFMSDIPLLPPIAKLTPNSVGFVLEMTQQSLDTLCLALAEINATKSDDDLGAFFLQNLHENLKQTPPLKSPHAFSVEIKEFNGIKRKGRLVQQQFQSFNMIVPMFLIQIKMLRQAAKSMPLSEEAEILIDQLTVAVVHAISHKSIPTANFVERWLKNAITFRPDYNYNLGLTMIGTDYIGSPKKDRLQVLVKILNSLHGSSPEYIKLLQLAKKKAKEMNCPPHEVVFGFSDQYYTKLFSQQIAW